jgi:hypothetical protein
MNTQHLHSSTWLDFSALPEGYLDEVIAFAHKVGKYDSLCKGFEHLARLGQNGGKPAIIIKDFAPYSFNWQACGMFGGLIYHGPHDGGGDGGAPTFSVSLTPTHGWQLHS